MGQQAEGFLLTFPGLASLNSAKALTPRKGS